MATARSVRSSLTARAALAAPLVLALAGCELELGESDSGGFTFADVGTTDTGTTPTDTGTTPTDTGTTPTDTGGGVTPCTIWAGSGVCQPSTACGAVQAPAPACGTAQICCYAGPLPSCEVDGVEGECTYTSACGSGYRSERSTCAGPENVGCCVPEVDTCNADGFDGVCIDVATCEGVSTPGLCPGPTNIQCCTDPIVCEVDGIAGVCIDTDLCDDGRRSTPGFCPGAANVQCCHDPASSGPCGENFFHCDNGDCIPKSDLCDYKNDCGDYSDEFGCVTAGGVDCEANQLRCPERCVGSGKACNGTTECDGGYDEADCDAE